MFAITTRSQSQGLADSIQDPVSLLNLTLHCIDQAYEMLSILEGTSMMAQQAMHKGSKLKHEDSHNLDFYFDKACSLMSLSHGSFCSPQHAKN